MQPAVAEIKRRFLVRRLEILDSSREAAYDALVELAADITGFPGAALTLCDGDRQWFKASVGLSERQTPIEESLCKLTIEQAKPVHLAHLDTLEDFKDHPARSGPNQVRTYLGVPVICGRAQGAGTAVASLSVFSGELRIVEPHHIERLSRLAVAVGELFEERLRRSDETEGADRQGALMRIAARLARCGGWSFDLVTEKVYWSPEVFDILEVPRGPEPSLSDALSLYPDEWRPLITEAIQRAATEGVPFDLELEILTRRQKRLRVRAAGEGQRNLEGRITRVVGVFMDLSAQHG